MKLILQRVSSAIVFVDEEEISRINKGLLVFFCAEKGDCEKQVNYLADKTLNLRVFADDVGKMNFSCLDGGGDILVVSQFTLAGDCTRGRRPGFEHAANPGIAQTLYEYYVKLLKRSVLNIDVGRFTADMQLKLVNDGPVTFLLER